MARGGARPNAGRKTNHEREVRRLQEQQAQQVGFNFTPEEQERYWERIKQDALDGKRDAQKLLAEYAYGRPTQQKEQQSETEFRLWCSFRGEPFVCLECQQKKETVANADHA